MDKEKALSAVRVGRLMGCIAFVAFLAGHAVGVPTMPRWGILEVLRGAALSFAFAAICAGISYLYQTNALARLGVGVGRADRNGR